MKYLTQNSILLFLIAKQIMLLLCLFIYVKDINPLTTFLYQKFIVDDIAIHRDHR